MPYYNPYSRRQRGYNPFLNRTGVSPAGGQPTYTPPTTQNITTYRKWGGGYKLYDPFAFQPVYNPIQTPAIGGAYTLPTEGYFNWKTAPTYRRSYGTSPRVTVGSNMAFRPSPYGQPRPTPPSTYGGGQPPMLNQIKDIFTLAQNIGATPQMIQAYLQARGANPYSIDIVDFLRWWQNYTALNTPYETMSSITPTGG